MLTVRQLSKKIKKPEYTIRDYINSDERFRECFWHKEEVEFDNISGKYKKLEKVLKCKQRLSKNLKGEEYEII